MRTIKVSSILLILAALAGCNWGIESPYEDASDARDVQPDRPDTIDVDADPPRDPDGTDFETTEPDVTDGDPADPDNPPDPVEDDAADVPDTPDTPDTPDVPDTPDLEPDEPDEPDAPDEPDTPDLEPDEVGPICGDGHVDAGEECDDTGGFCVACALTAPTGWIECTDASGNPVFFHIFDMPGNHSHDDFRDQCLSDVQALAPVGFGWYGLAVFSDQAVWDCVSAALGAANQYYIGLQQDRGASDYVEPAGGWYWVGYDGTGWSNLTAYDPANTWIDEAMDNGGGTGNADCGRLTSTAGNWTFSDYSCTSTTAWQAICMVQF